MPWTCCSAESSFALAERMVAVAASSCWLADRILVDGPIAVIILLRLKHIGIGDLDICLGLALIGFRHAELGQNLRRIGLRARQRHLLVPGVQLHQDLAGGDMLIVVHQHLCHPAGDLRRDGKDVAVDLARHQWSHSRD